MTRRNGYREGLKGVQVWLSLALHGQAKAGAAREGLSLNDWVSEAIREKVMRDADAGTGRGLRVAAVADQRGPRSASGGDGSGAARVGSGDVSGPVTPDWDAIMAAGRASRPLVGAVEPMLPLDAPDPFGSDHVPAPRDARGRLVSPIVRDEWIDTA